MPRVGACRFRPVCPWLTLTPSPRLAHAQVWPGNVKATPVQGDSSIPANTYVWRIVVTKRAVRTLIFGVLLQIDACHTGGVLEAEGSFWPLGRQVPTCGYGYGDPVPFIIKANPLKCPALKGAKKGGNIIS